MTYGIIPTAEVATAGFDYTGMAVYASEAGKPYEPVWCGEFHGTVGSGKVSDFARSIATPSLAYIYLSDHRTGEVRYVHAEWAQRRKV
jgi:hypothetical protein